MSQSNQIICNAITTPDGTYLRSYDRWDYKEHKDQVSGETYMVDGGTAYIRRSMNTVPPTFMDVYLTDPFEDIRQAFVWKSYGKNGEFPEGIYLTLNAMTTEHIHAILDTQHHIKGSYVEELMLSELAYRKERL